MYTTHQTLTDRKGERERADTISRKIGRGD